VSWTAGCEAVTEMKGRSSAFLIGQLVLRVLAVGRDFILDCGTYF